MRSKTASFFAGGEVHFGEQMVFTVERPKGQPIMTATMVANRLADPAELEDVPILSTRIIPNSGPGSGSRSPSWRGSTGRPPCTPRRAGRRAYSPAAIS